MTLGRDEGRNSIFIRREIELEREQYLVGDWFLAEALIPSKRDGYLADLVKCGMNYRSVGMRYIMKLEDTGYVNCGPDTENGAVCMAELKSWGC